MAFFTRKIHRTLGGNYTFLICTDRKDLDSQIYKTFAGCGLADNDKVPCRADSGPHLQSLLQGHTPYVFTLIQKFNQDVDPEQPYSERNDIIVISDEAHHTQYGRLALNLRNALPTPVLSVLPAHLCLLDFGLIYVTYTSKHSNTHVKLMV